MIDLDSGDCADAFMLSPGKIGLHAGTRYGENVVIVLTSEEASELRIGILRAIREAVGDPLDKAE